MMVSVNPTQQCGEVVRITMRLSSVLLMLATTVSPVCVAWAEDEHPLSVSLVAGGAIPSSVDNALPFGVGAGVRCERTFGDINVGALVAAHAGSTLQRLYVEGRTAGTVRDYQYYTSHPFVFAADFGYDFHIALGALDTILSPSVNAGAILIQMSSYGPFYGDGRTTKLLPVMGLGLRYVVNLEPQWFAGVDYRISTAGHAVFGFGESHGRVGPVDRPLTYEHSAFPGGSASVFYHALFTELGYRF